MGLNLSSKETTYFGNCLYTQISELSKIKLVNLMYDSILMSAHLPVPYIIYKPINHISFYNDILSERYITLSHFAIQIMFTFSNIFPAYFKSPFNLCFHKEFFELQNWHLSYISERQHVFSIARSLLSNTQRTAIRDTVNL